jgi:hypothetical protein
MMGGPGGNSRTRRTVEFRPQAPDEYGAVIERFAAIGVRMEGSFHDRVPSMSEPDVVPFDAARNLFRETYQKIVRLYGPGSEEAAALGMLTFAARALRDAAGLDRTRDILAGLEAHLEEERTKP